MATQLQLLAGFSGGFHLLGRGEGEDLGGYPRGRGIRVNKVRNILLLPPPPKKTGPAGNPGWYSTAHSCRPKRWFNPLKGQHGVPAVKIRIIFSERSGKLL